VLAPGLMLAGIAIEAMVKALVVQGQGAGFRDLADRAHITLSPEESTLLKELEQFVVWRARYPIPRTQAHARTNWSIKMSRRAGSSTPKGGSTRVLRMRRSSRSERLPRSVL